MDAPPPVPARPAEFLTSQRQDTAPPVPPLPPGFMTEQIDIGRSASPMIAPRPQRNFGNAPADMAKSLEAQAGYGRSLFVATPGLYRGPSPGPLVPVPGNQYPNGPVPFPRPISAAPAYPEFKADGYASPPPLNVPLQPFYGTPIGSPIGTLPQPSTLANGSQFRHGRLTPPTVSFSRLGIQESFGQNPPPLVPPTRDYDVTAPAVFRPELIPFAPIIPRPAPGRPPVLTVSLPTIESLTAASASVANLDNLARRLAWSRQVMNLVERTLNLEQSLNPVSNSSVDGPRISDPRLIALTDQAIPQILALCEVSAVPMPPYVAEAMYLRGSLAASGMFPQFVRRDLQSSFKDFETAGRNGYDAGWFKIGRDYEGVQDFKRAMDVFERGVRLGEKNCLYRMGMAHLQGHLGLSRNPELAVPLLKQSADHADADSPQAAYVFGMILLGEFSHIDIPPIALLRYLPRPSAANPDPRMTEAKRYIERAAYLGYGPAQTKAGWAHEFAKMGCAYDPLLSVQYYSLASQQGEEEADMALSKWFLCGAEGHFEKDESLAHTFAEKAARKGLPTAEFAMGYYHEVGVGVKKDLAMARRWYEKAASHGNADASARLKALSQLHPEALSRAQHESITHNTLVRKRTQAKEGSIAAGRRPITSDGRYASQVAQNAMKASSKIMPTMPKAPSPPNPTVSPPAPAPAPAPANPPPQPTPAPRIHYFGRPSVEFKYSARAQTGSASPPSHQSPARKPISLSDPPVPTAGSPPRPASQPQDKPQQTPASNKSSSTAVSAGTPAAQAPAKKGPATFQEMGYQSQALDDKDCVIM